MKKLTKCLSKLSKGFKMVIRSRFETAMALNFHSKCSIHFRQKKFKKATQSPPDTYQLFLI